MADKTTMVVLVDQLNQFAEDGSPAPLHRGDRAQFTKAEIDRLGPTALAPEGTPAAEFADLRAQNTATHDVTVLYAQFTSGRRAVEVPDPIAGDPSIGASVSGQPNNTGTSAEPNVISDVRSGFVPPAPVAPGAGEQPKANASRKEWAEFAKASGASDEEVADPKDGGLSRDDLAAKYGTAQGSAE